MSASMGALVLIGLAFASLEAGAQPMRKQDAKQPVFVGGPAIGPEVEAWVRGHEAKDANATFRLPFTIWRRGGARGAVAAAGLGRLGDTAGAAAAAE